MEEDGAVFIGSVFDLAYIQYVMYLLLKREQFSSSDKISLSLFEIFISFFFVGPSFCVHAGE
jgi:hypothetical protein